MKMTLPTRMYSLNKVLFIILNIIQLNFSVLAQNPPIAALPSVAGDLAGSIHGEFSVNASGSAVYTMALAVPPGTHGMQPKLALTYTSNTATGIIGPGWSLDGLSVISRCSTTLALDGFIDGVNFNPSDRFCLDGQRLIAISGLYGASNSEYRTHYDGFARVRSQGQTGVGPASFVVTQKNGLTYEYGNTPDSKVQNQGQPSILAWKLNRITDRVGNALTISYQADQINGEYLPLRIDYTSNSSAGVAAFNSVRFEYTTLVLPITRFVSGAQVSMLHHLKTIKMYTGATEAWEYRLWYLPTEPNAQEVRIWAIEECSAQGVCLPGTNVFWVPDSSSSPLFSTFARPSNLVAPGSNVPVPSGDWNGDGKTDFAIVKNSGVTPYTASSAGFEAYGTITNTGINSTALSTYAVIVGDWNGDGKTDIGRVTPNGRTTFYNSTGTGFSTLYALADFAPYYGYGDINVNPILTGDWNGDGRTDVARVNGSGVRFYVSTGISFALMYDLPHLGTNEGYSNNNYYPIVTGDWNGDGLTDIARVHNDGMWFFVSTGTTYTAFTNLPDLGRNAGYTDNNTYPVITGDWNGDGNTDLARVGDQFVRFFDNLGNGVFSQPRALAALSIQQGFTNGNTYPIFVGDWNGDGVNDVARVGASGISYFTQKGGQFTSLGTLADLSPAQGFLSASAYPMVVGDWNGDGFTDVARSWSTNLASYTRTANKSSLLNNIIDGSHKRIQFSHKPLTNSSVYTKGEGALYPQLDVSAPFYVVSDVAVTDGIGGFAWSFYRYTGLQFEVNGRGVSGFKQIDVSDYNTGITTTTLYRQDFPFKGFPYQQDTKLSNGTLISRKQDTWAVKNFSAGSYFPYTSRTISASYELNGSFVKSVTEDHQFDDFGNPTQTAVTYSDGASETTNNTYNSDTSSWLLGQLTSSQVTKRAINGALPVTRRSSMLYSSANGLLQSETIEPNSPLALTKAYQYDAFGNVRILTISGADIETRVETTNYDSRGQFPIQLINALGQSETRDYDARHGQIARSTGPNLLTKQWNYDVFGRMTYEYQPDGTQRRNLYHLVQSSGPANAEYYIREDSSGRPAVITYYDVLNREIQKQTVGFDGRIIVSDQIFDKRGHVIKVSEPYFSGDTPQWNLIEHDVLGRTTSIIAPGDRRTVIDYYGLMTVTTNPLNQIRSETVDARGNKLIIGDDYNNLLRYSYDGFNNVVTSTDSENNVTRIEYDQRGKKTRLVDPDLGTTLFTYDVLGQQLSQTNAKNEATRFAYDKLGRMVGKVSPEGTETITYDTAARGIGKIARVLGLNGYAKTFAYDNLGREQTVVKTITSTAYSMTQNYDQYGRVASITYPSGFAVRNVYNAFGYLSQVTRASDGFVYWRANNKNAHGQLENFTLGNGIVTKQTFAPTTGFLQTIQSDPVQNLTFQFDALGNLSQRQDLRVGTIENFMYDRLNRLTQSQVTGQASITLVYSSIGNIISRSDVGTYSYGGASGGPHSVTSIIGSVPNSYSYDLVGNRIASNGGTVTYNSSAKPIVITQGGNQLQFSLDENGSRIEERSYNKGRLRERKVFVGDIYERVFGRSGSQDVHYIQAGEHIIGVYISSGQTRYLHHDQLGSIQAITDETGGLMEVNSYDSWGKKRNPQSWLPSFAGIASIIDRGFTGHEQLDAVNLIHMNGRVYDPLIGRFISPDPFVQSPENLQSLNRYSYAMNNPLSFTDPSGFFLRGLFHFLGKVFHQFAPMIIGFAVGNIAGLWLNATLLCSATFDGISLATASMVGAAGSSIASAFTTSLLSGGDLHATLLSGVVGALSGFMSYYAPTILGPDESLAEFAKNSFDKATAAEAHLAANDALSAFKESGVARISAGGADNMTGGLLSDSFNYLHNTNGNIPAGDVIVAEAIRVPLTSSESGNSAITFSKVIGGVKSGLGEVGSFMIANKKVITGAMDNAGTVASAWGVPGLATFLEVGKIAIYPEDLMNTEHFVLGSILERAKVPKQVIKAFDQSWSYMEKNLGRASGEAE